MAFFAPVTVLDLVPTLLALEPEALDTFLNHALHL
jgi:hypothetical protein